MSDKKAVPRAKVDKKGWVSCPSCNFKIPVPDTHSLAQGIGVCPNGHPFLVDQECVLTFHHHLSKQGSNHSKEMLKNVEETPRVVKDAQDQVSEGGIVLP